MASPRTRLGSWLAGSPELLPHVVSESMGLEDPPVPGRPTCEAASLLARPMTTGEHSTVEALLAAPALGNGRESEHPRPPRAPAPPGPSSSRAWVPTVLGSHLTVDGRGAHGGIFPRQSGCHVRHGRDPSVTPGPRLPILSSSSSRSHQVPVSVCLTSILATMTSTPISLNTGNYSVPHFP